MTLLPIDISDQRFPCSVSTDHGRCRARAKFRITPTCGCDPEAWPTAQACTPHLARVVQAASARCTGHLNGEIVRVRPLGVKR
jgi:hypothetical protein